MILVVKKEFLDFEVGTKIDISNPHWVNCGAINKFGLNISFNWREAIKKGFLEEGISFPFKVGDWIRIKEEPKKYFDPVNKNKVLSPLSNFGNSTKHPGRRSYPAIGFITDIDFSFKNDMYPCIGFSLRISNEDFGFSYEEVTKNCFERIEPVKSTTEIEIGDWLASPKFQTKSEKDYVVYQVFDKVGLAFGLHCLNDYLTLGNSDIEGYNFIKISAEEAEKLLLLKPLKQGDKVKIVPIYHPDWGKHYKKIADKIVTMSCLFSEKLGLGTPIEIACIEEHRDINFTRLSLRALSKEELERIEPKDLLADKAAFIKKAKEEFGIKAGTVGETKDGICIYMEKEPEDSHFMFKSEKRVWLRDSFHREIMIFSNNEFQINKFIRAEYIDGRMVEYEPKTKTLNVGCKTFTFNEAISLSNIMGRNNMSIKFPETDKMLRYDDLVPIIKRIEENDF